MPDQSLVFVSGSLLTTDTRSRQACVHGGHILIKAWPGYARCSPKIAGLGPGRCFACTHCPGWFLCLFGISQCGGQRHTGSSFCHRGAQGCVPCGARQYET